MGAAEGVALLLEAKVLGPLLHLRLLALRLREQLGGSRTRI